MDGDDWMMVLVVGLLVGLAVILIAVMVFVGFAG